MLIHLHSQATTTPKVRSAIQASDEPAWIVAERHGISEQTVWKWRKRQSIEDRSHTPHRLQTTLTPAQEAVAVALRKTLLVSLDDLLAVVREFLNRASRALVWIAACVGMAWGICAISRPRSPDQNTAPSKPMSPATSTST
jgi:transposase-like protein